jgi:hypothetical protein
MQAVDLSVAGHRGDDQLFHAACILVIAWDLSPEQALPYLRDYNQRCEPPWPENRLLYKLSEANKRPDVRGQLRNQVPPGNGSPNPDLNPTNRTKTTRHLPARPQVVRNSDTSPQSSVPVPQLITVDQLAAMPEEDHYAPGPVLDEHATETELARLIQADLPPLRCVGEDWYVYRNGVWFKTTRNEFKPLSLSIQHPKTRTARKGKCCNFAITPW